MTTQVLTDLEGKLLRLLLDPAATPGEIRNAAVKLAESWRRRGVRPEDLIEKPPQMAWLDDDDPGDFVMPFGQYRGEPLRDIDPGYLRWVVKTCHNRPDVVAMVRQFLEERDDE